jgi:hypothetical protein
VTSRRTDRRRMLLSLGSTIGLLPLHTRRALSAGAPLRFALTPVLLTSDLVMLEELKAYALAGVAAHRTGDSHQELEGRTLPVARQATNREHVCG